MTTVPMMSERNMLPRQMARIRQMRNVMTARSANGSMRLPGRITARRMVMGVMSSVSVILQRYYFKLTHGKRIFLMSPIHHHFEKKGYSETQIVCMYADITLALSLAAVLSIL